MTNFFSSNFLKSVFRLTLVLFPIVLLGCAGRDAIPVATVQATDSQADCAQIRAEIQVNNSQLQKLADEEGLKLAQNMAAGTLGFFTLGIGWFALDAKGSAKKEGEALSARNQYLAALAQQRCQYTPQSQYAPPPQ
jgi:hypothetical protein